MKVEGKEECNPKGKRSLKTIASMSAMKIDMNGSVNVCLSKLAQDVCAKTITALANHYGFSEEEARGLIGAVELGKKTKNIKKSKGEKKERAPRETSIPLPFNGEFQEGCCEGLKQNHGLLTQCTNSPKESEAYCSTCQKQCDKNASGEPDNGTVTKRIQAHQEGREFRDPKGRAPTPYAKVMQKLKLTKEQVLAEVEKSGRSFDESNFVAPESKRGRPKKEASLTTDTDSEGGKKRGRPKKAAKAVEVSSTEDLFATLISEVKAGSPRPVVAMAAQEAMSDLSGSESDGESSNSKASKKSKMSDAEKSEKQQAKAQEKAEKEAAKAQEKAEKEVTKAQEKAEKEAAKAAQLAEKEAAKLQEKAKKDAAKAEEKAKKDAAKAEEKAKKDAAKKGGKAATAVATPAPVTEAEEAPKVLSVKVFNFQGVEYLRTADNVLYNKKTEECVGVFNEERQEIDECELEEESEEESDEDEDDE
jgi:hypothetical protein